METMICYRIFGIRAIKLFDTKKDALNWIAEMIAATDNDDEAFAVETIV